jgi:hypothetical protein
MNKELDAEGNEKGDCYVVQSLRDEDCFSKSKNAYVVTHIFSRQNDCKKYTELLYMAQSSCMGDLSEEIKSMLEVNLLPTEEIQ